jgi:hypothetical protein
VLLHYYAGEATRLGGVPRSVTKALGLAICQQPVGTICDAAQIAPSAGGWLRCMLRSSLTVADRSASSTEGCSTCQSAVV